MKKVLLIIALIATKVVAGEPDKAFHQQCLYPTVMIRDEKNGVGTGVIFRSTKTGEEYTNLVLTNDHIIGGVKADLGLGTILFTKSFIVRIGVFKDWSTLTDYNDFVADVVGKEPTVDFAILSFKSKTVMPVATLDQNPKLYIGDEVYRVGCGAGEFLKVDRGQVTAINSLENMNFTAKDCIRTSVPTIMGDSGGPNFYKTKEGNYKCFGLTQSVRRIILKNEIKIKDEKPIKVPIEHVLFHVSYVIPLNRLMDLEKIKL